MMWEEDTKGIKWPTNKRERGPATVGCDPDSSVAAGGEGELGRKAWYQF